ncbi:MAG: hypothetical protein AABY15_01700 [Nanoarchaeota archaeon]
MAKKKEDDSKFVEIDGFKCEVKDPNKRNTVLHYQHYLALEVDKYVSDNIMTESREAYADGLMANIKLAPFVLGWLKSPGDNEKLVIAGFITMAEFIKRKKSEESQNKKQKRATQKAAPDNAP